MNSLHPPESVHMHLPLQSEPIKRPTFFESDLRRIVIQGEGETEIAIFSLVLESSPNPNDPAQFLGAFECGCHLYAQTSMSLCLAACRLL
jgi:hypothetical protein